MAQRTNTVEYSFAARTTSLSAATRHDFSAVTVHIAETTSRTVRSAFVEVWARDNAAAAASVTSWLIGVAIDGGAANDATVTNTIANSGDQQSWCFRRDVTSVLASGFTGSSHSIVVGVAIGGIATINVCARLVVTYEYDDTGLTTATKTVRIPIESNTGSLTATIAELGTNQIPALTGGSGILPEASITIRDVYLDVFGNEGHASGTTDDQLFLEIDAEGETGFGSLEEALDSSPFMRVLWKRTDIDTTSAHALSARGLNTGRCPQLGAVLVVTYTYDASTSTSVFNSLMLPLPVEAGALGGTTSALQNRMSTTLLVEEPATVTLQQSGVILTYNCPNNALAGLHVGVGAQTARSYTPATAINSAAGQFSLVHRFDSGGAAGSGLTLARGENTITVTAYRTSSVTANGLSGYVLLNYTSGKATAGVGAHNHTTYWLASATAAVGTTGVTDTAAFAPVIPETSYWLSHAGAELTMLHGSRGQVTIAAQRVSGDTPTSGWQTAGAYQWNSSNEVGVCQHYADLSAFYRHPADPRPDGLALEGSRVYRVQSFLESSSTNCGWQSVLLAVTYHAITWSVSRAVSGYSGDGSGIAVRVHRSDTGETLYTATTAAGGGYTFAAYDSTVELYAEARQGALAGRSENFTPS